MSYHSKNIRYKERIIKNSSSNHIINYGFVFTLLEPLTVYNIKNSVLYRFTERNIVNVF